MLFELSCHLAILTCIQELDLLMHFIRAIEQVLGGQIRRNIVYTKYLLWMQTRNSLVVANLDHNWAFNV